MAVNEEAITLLDTTTMQSVARVPYSAVVTFGGCQDDLMVVVNNCDIQGPGTQRMLFSLAKPKVSTYGIKIVELNIQKTCFDCLDSGTDAAHC